MFDPQQPARGYALTWPRELFRLELSAVVNSLADDDQRAALGQLFEEALRGPDPSEDLAEIPGGPNSLHDPWGLDPHPSDEELPENYCRQFGREVLASVDDLPVHAPRAYYLWRQRPPEPAEPTADWLTLQREWMAAVEDLVLRGYLDRRAGDACEDGKENEQPARINQLILEHCSLGGQWPLALDEGGYATDQDYFFTLVEVFHDLVARPRLRDWHSYDEHYRYSTFDDSAGQAVYRWKVNELLTRHGAEMELADAGEDRGLLVHAPTDSREDLVAAALVQPGADGDKARHAVTLFRSRTADVEAKRSACIALAGVLESRRKLLKDELLSKDEGACSRSLTSSVSVTRTPTSAPTMTRLTWTGSSGGTWRRSS